MAKKTDNTDYFVYCNLPNGHSFALPGEKTWVFKGVPTSRLVGAQGESLPTGRYGKTGPVPADDWGYIRNTYGKMDMFKEGVHGPAIFADQDEAAGDARAAEYYRALSGFEQVDVETETQTKKAED